MATTLSRGVRVALTPTLGQSSRAVRTSLPSTSILARRALPTTTSSQSFLSLSLHSRSLSTLHPKAPFPSFTQSHLTKSYATATPANKATATLSSPLTGTPTQDAEATPSSTAKSIPDSAYVEEGPDPLPPSQPRIIVADPAKGRWNLSGVHAYVMALLLHITVFSFLIMDFLNDAFMWWGGVASEQLGR